MRRHPAVQLRSAAANMKAIIMLCLGGRTHSKRDAQTEVIGVGVGVDNAATEAAHNGKKMA